MSLLRSDSAPCIEHQARQLAGGLAGERSATVDTSTRPHPCPLSQILPSLDVHRYGNLLVDEQENVKRVQLASDYLDGSASLAGGREPDEAEVRVWVWWEEGSFSNVKMAAASACIWLCSHACRRPFAGVAASLGWSCLSIPNWLPPRSGWPSIVPLQAHSLVQASSKLLMRVCKQALADRLCVVSASAEGGDGGSQEVSSAPCGTHKPDDGGLRGRSGTRDAHQQPSGHASSGDAVRRTQADQRDCSLDAGILVARQHSVHKRKIFAGTAGLPGIVSAGRVGLTTISCLFLVIVSRIPCFVRCKLCYCDTAGLHVCWWLKQLVPLDGCNNTSL